jgi:hypothetical protein
MKDYWAIGSTPQFIYLLDNQASSCAISSYLLDYIKNLLAAEIIMKVYIRTSKQSTVQSVYLLDATADPTLPPIRQRREPTSTPAHRHHTSVEEDDLLDATAASPFFPPRCRPHPSREPTTWMLLPFPHLAAAVSLPALPPAIRRAAVGGWTRLDAKAEQRLATSPAIAFLSRLDRLC